MMTAIELTNPMSNHRRRQCSTHLQRPPDPARIGALRHALHEVLASGSDAFLYRSGGENLQRAVEGLNHFGATGNTLVLRDSIVAGLALLEIVLRHARGTVSAQRLVESSAVAIVLDAETRSLSEKDHRLS